MDRVAALVWSELRLILRNRTLLTSVLVVPLALGVFLTVTQIGSPSYVVAMQLVFALGMGVYVGGTQTLVARRQSRVLKRFRTSGISDGGLLAGTIGPAAVLALAQMVLFALFDVVAGLEVPTAPLALPLAVVGGLALVTTAALATTIVTPSAERAQITTLPLFFVVVGSAVIIAVIPAGGWPDALALLPGGALGALSRVAYGAPWTPYLLVSLVVWPLLFGWLAARHFRWDARVAAA
ncbi:ABC transporter permease [Pseudonocardia sp. RS010]|uniref:ABC transporter permease n=1 Tax=Pseudonocardia sp. RS010 TaxID=3385979 RepID=UPI0039A33487